MDALFGVELHVITFRMDMRHNRIQGTDITHSKSNFPFMIDTNYISLMKVA